MQRHTRIGDERTREGKHTNPWIITFSIGLLIASFSSTGKHRHFTPLVYTATNSNPVIRLPRKTQSTKQYFSMFSLPILAFIVCGVLQSAHALEQCPGAADDSHEDFAWKYNASSIVAFGTVSQVTDNVVTFQVSCTLKGQLTETTIQFNQFRESISSYARP